MGAREADLPTPPDGTLLAGTSRRQYASRDPGRARPRVRVHCRPVFRFLDASIPFVAAVGLCACASAPIVHDPSARTVQARGADDRTVRYRHGPVPASWDSVDIPGNDLAWHDRDSGGVAHVDHTCQSGQDIPLSSLVQHLLIGFSDRDFVEEETVPFDAREARHVVVRARLDGVAQMIELYVLKKDGCVWDLGFVAAPDSFARGRAGFTEFARGFATTDTGLAPSGGGRR